MTIVVTGSAGHLGEALMRTLQAAERPARGLDVLRPSRYTTHVGSIGDADFVRRLHGRRDGRDPRRDPAQTACRHPLAPRPS